MAVTSRRWLVSGRVQGVGFRAFCIRAANALGVKGWVQNLTDGRVEVVATGRPDELTRLADALRQGPSFARVDHIEESTVDDPVDCGPVFDVRFGP